MAKDPIPVSGSLELSGSNVPEDQAVPVKQIGGIVPLGTITGGTVVTAGSSIAISTRQAVTKYKNIRAVAFWASTPSTWDINIDHHVADEVGSVYTDTKNSTVAKDALEATTKAEYCTVSIFNGHTSDKSLSRAQALGVR